MAKSLIRDMIEDLAMFTVNEVDHSIKAYRRNADNRFFPTSGQLRAPILETRKEAHRDAKISQMPIPADLRPIRWWLLPRAVWKPEWHEQDAPDGSWVRDKDTGEYRKAWRF